MARSRKPDPVPPLTEQFLEDLKLVHSMDCVAHDVAPTPSGALEPSADELERLAAALEAYRAGVVRDVNPFVASLGQGSPLTCPIGLFDPTGRASKEVAHTKALAWFLDPSQPHGFEHALIDAVLEHLGAKEHVGRTKRVEAEVPVKRGRLDVLATADDGTHVLVIEAKIESGERNDQLADYDKCVGSAACRVFLSLNGRPPTSGEGWIPLSFPTLAGVLWKAGSGISNPPPGLELLRHYVAGVFKDLVGLPLPLSPGGVCESNLYAIDDYRKAEGLEMAP